jgi:heme-degrading monooxygenase HmoA
MMAMIELKDLDPDVSIRDQLHEASEEPVILINVFHAEAGEQEALLQAWADDARYFKAQPGFISTQLHRGTAGSRTYLNYAVWESVGAFRAAFSNPLFHAKLNHYPDGTTSAPHLVRKVAVEGLCTA